MSFGMLGLIAVASLMATSLSSTPEKLLKSERVRQVLKEAEAASGRTITIEAFSSAGLYSGETNLAHVPEIIIQINPSLPYRTGTSNLIHELYHVLLATEGLQLTAGSTKFNEPGDVGRLFTAVGKQLINCYVDPVIDRRIAERGFHPERVIRLTSDGLAATPTDGIVRSSAWNPMWINYAALQLYALSLRPAKFEISDVEKTYAVVPKIIEKKRELQRQLGSPVCDSPRGCFDVTIKLRNAAGFNPDILILNPETKQYE